MLIRYKVSENGKLIRQAEVFTQNEHGIQLSDIDPDALAIIRHLNRAGFEAYIVGGAVRDVLLGKKPKDFDVSTNAKPMQIRQLFRNSRVIGRRFRLVHVFFHRTKIIEVSTFRSGQNNGFGRLDEDVMRRDFSVNALYYDPFHEQIVDFVSGFTDLKTGKLRVIIPLKEIFIEDPVRIIRAIKYMVKTGLKPNYLLRRQIRRHAPLLNQVSHSRITEEIYKILESGYASPIFRQLHSFSVMKYVLGHIDCHIQANGTNMKRFLNDLAETDRLQTSSRAKLIVSLVRDYMIKQELVSRERFTVMPQLYDSIKTVLRPMSPANKDVEEASLQLLEEQGWSLPGYKVRPRRKRRRRS